ncbi:MAG: hypothetical protein IJ770_03970 [Alphaproteobacteria bacterium]|nr:hypothetical protein [Alphaproteobacteria bacterium]
MKKFLFILSVCFVWCTAAVAKISYEVAVPVEVEAENSVVAKEQAMTQAQRKAFLEVAGKLTSAENVEKLAALEDGSVQHFIQSVGVANEKAGGTKYIADLTVEINESLLKEYLAENEMIKTEAEELLVIPVFRRSPQGYPLLWEEDNLWRQNWHAKGLVKFGTMQMRTVGEEYRYAIEDFSAENALYMPDEIYRQIRQINNGTEKVYVVFAETQENGDLEITVKNEQSKAEDSFSVLRNDDSDIFDKAIEKSVMFIANMERAAKNNSADNTVKTIDAVYMYQDMKDWLLKSKVLAELEPVEGIETKSFGGGKVNFSISYTGSLDSLWDILQENGFSHEQTGNYFIIR